jgi:hypothetical protein
MNSEFQTRVSELTEFTPEQGTFEWHVGQSIPRVKLGTLSDGHSQGNKFVYMEGHPYVMGYLYYGDPRDNPSVQENHYVVASDNIVNGKYANYSKQHSMRMTIKLDQAVTHAKRYLRPMPWGVVASIDYKEITSGFGRLRQEFAEEYRKARESLGISAGKGLVNELKHLVNMGHDFLDNGVKDRVMNMLEKHQAYHEDREKKLNATFVYAYVKWNEERYIVCDLSDIDRNRSHLQDWKNMDYKEYTANTLPAELKGKIMSLNVLEGKGFVDDVGYKAGDNMFYVAL